MCDHRTGARRILDLVANKWTPEIIRCLSTGGKRPTELMARIEGISQKMLTQTLRQMQSGGLVARTVHAEVPPHVDYQLTPLGLSLIEPLDAFGRWAQEHRVEINASETARRQSSARPARNPSPPVRRAGGKRPGVT